MNLTKFKDDFEKSSMKDKYELISVVGRNKRGLRVWEVMIKEKELRFDVPEALA